MPIVTCSQCGNRFDDGEVRIGLTATDAVRSIATQRRSSCPEAQGAENTIDELRSGGLFRSSEGPADGSWGGVIRNGSLSLDCTSDHLNKFATRNKPLELRRDF